METEIEKTRERLIKLLGTYYARGAYGIEEYERLVDEVHRMASTKELEQMIDRLPALPSSPGAGSQEEVDARVRQPLQPPGVRGRRNHFLINIFSGTARSGAWLPAPAVNVLNLFGSAELDFREASLPPGGVTVRAFCLFGSADIITGDGVNVSVEGFGLFGGFNSKAAQARRPDVPTVRVVGFCLFGAVEVKRKRRK